MELYVGSMKSEKSEIIDSTVNRILGLFEID